MSFGKGSSPNVIQQQPNPAQLAAAQAEANRITQFTPTGDIVFGNVDTSGAFTPQAGAALQVNPTPAQEVVRELGEIGTIDLAANAATRAGQLPIGPLDFQGLPQFQSEIDFSQVGAVPQANLGQLGEIPQAFQPGPNNLGLNTFNTAARFDIPGFGNLIDIPRPEQFAPQAAALEEATAQRALNLLSPELERRERSLGQTIFNRGLSATDEAAQNELIQPFERNRNQLLEQIALGSVAAGRAEQQRLFQNALAGRGQQVGEQAQRFGQAFADRQRAAAENAQRFGQLFGAEQLRAAQQAQQFGQQLTGRDALSSQLQGLFGQQLTSRGAQLGDLQLQLGLNNLARQTGFAERQATRGGEFNELAALLGLQQVQTPQLSQFVQPGQVDIIGPAALAQQNALAQQQLANQRQQSVLGGLFGLGSALGSAALLQG